jgi:hypothetical protein
MTSFLNGSNAGVMLGQGWYQAYADGYQSDGSVKLQYLSFSNEHWLEGGKEFSVVSDRSGRMDGQSFPIISTMVRFMIPP